MVYGLVFKDYGKEVQPLSISEQVFGISSIVYDEYINRKTLMECLLEETIDDTERIRLEAQLEVLREISFKDIKDKIIKLIKGLIEKIQTFINWIKEKVLEFFKKLKEFFKGKSIKQLVEEKKKEKSTTNESYISEVSTIKDINKWLEEKRTIKVNPHLDRVYKNLIELIHRNVADNNIIRLDGTNIFLMTSDFDKFYLEEYNDYLYYPDGYEYAKYKNSDICSFIGDENKWFDDFENNIIKVCQELISLYNKYISDLNKKIKEIENMEETANVSLSNLTLGDILGKAEDSNNEKEDLNRQISFFTKKINMAKAILAESCRYITAVKSLVSEMKSELSRGDTE